MGKKFNLGLMTAQNNQMTEIPGDALVYNNEYDRYQGEQFNDMVESIKQNGILQPLIVRPIDGEKYIILSGNNRKYCGEAAGLTVFPCLVKEGISDEEAQVYIDETNIYQRGFSNLRITKQAEVVARRHEKMFSKEKLDAIREEIAVLNGDPVSAEKTCDEPAKSKLAKVGEEYGLGKTSIARLIRIYKLDDSLKPFIDNEQISQRTGVDLSYIPVNEQRKVAQMVSEGHSVTMKQAAQLKEIAEQGILNEDIVAMVITNTYKPKTKSKKAKSVKVKAAIIKKYFAIDTSEDVIADTIDKALNLYFASSKKEE